MSREGAKRETVQAPTGGTPIWVWLVYGLGMLGATILIASGLFVLGAYIAEDDVPVSTNVSIPALVIWGGLVLVAVVLWLRRRSGRAQ